MNREIYSNYSCYLIINMSKLRKSFPVLNTTIFGNRSADNKCRVAVAFGLVPEDSVK